MENYSLFLDEIHAGGHFDYFCLAGIAVNSKEYTEDIIPIVNDIKRDLFNGDTSIVLHEQEIQKNKSNTPFQVFQKRENKIMFWDGMKKILKDFDVHGFAVAIHEEQLETLYKNGRDKYSVALQVITENYVHFLENADATGNIHIESTDANPFQRDEQLQHQFHYLKANGTLFYDKRILQKRLGTINTPFKADNIIGLQLADLVPNSLNRKLCNKKQRTYGFINTFKQIAYDGNVGDKQRFGIKVIP
ncbi:DUF3800 domain-containing protein [Virgibacillus halodenitrificans]|nr:DUF3800 domain-containing protein [Virgibacillus halodenitrificans]